MPAQSVEPEPKLLLLFDSNVGREVSITPNHRWRRRQERRLMRLRSLPQVDGVRSLYNFNMLDRPDDEIVLYLRKWVRQLRKLEGNENTRLLLITRDRRFVRDSRWSPDGFLHVCLLPRRLQGASLPVGEFKKTALIGLITKHVPMEYQRITRQH